MKGANHNLPPENSEYPYWAVELGYDPKTGKVYAVDGKEWCRVEDNPNYNNRTRKNYGGRTTEIFLENDVYTDPAENRKFMEEKVCPHLENKEYPYVMRFTGSKSHPIHIRSHKKLFPAQWEAWVKETFPEEVWKQFDWNEITSNWHPIPDPEKPHHKTGKMQEVIKIFLKGHPIDPPKHILKIQPTAGEKSKNPANSRTLEEILNDPKAGHADRNSLAVRLKMKGWTFSRACSFILLKNKWKNYNKEETEKELGGVWDWKDIKDEEKTGRKKKGKAKIEIKTATKLVRGDVLYELVYSEENGSRFVSLSEKGIPEYHDCVGDIFPHNSDIIRKEAVSIPSDVLDYGTDSELLLEVKQFIHRYVDVSPLFEKFCSYYVLLSHVFDQLTVVPYLRTLGDFGTGKSRVLDVVGGICYRPIVCAGNISPAALFRVQEQFRGTLVIDEADRNKSDESDDLIKIINCGFEKGKLVWRVDKNNPDNLQTFDPYGPKVISTRRQFHDQATESRCLTEVMMETGREDIPIILLKSFYRERDELRNKLLMYRLKTFGNIDSEAAFKIDLGIIEPRLKQVLSNFGLLFQSDEKMLEDFKKFAISHQSDLIQDRESTYEGIVVNFLWNLTEEEKESEENPITPGLVAEHIESVTKIEKFEPRKAGMILKGLGIRSKKRRIKNKTHNEIVWDDVLMQRLAKKYILSEFEHSLRNVQNTWNTRNKKARQQVLNNQNVPSVPSVPLVPKTVEKGDNDA